MPKNLLPFERLAIHVGWEMVEFDCCQLDRIVAAYIVFVSAAETFGLDPLMAFKDAHEKGEMGLLKVFMQEHYRTAHGGPDTPPIR
jgi:hypothetical protein